MKQIRVVDNQGEEYTYPVDSAVAEVSVGRSESNDIILSSKTVSRRHAILKIMGDRVLLVNQSSNGVLVDGERIDRVSELDFGEFAIIEPYRLCVEADGEQSTSPGRGRRSRDRGRGDDGVDGRDRSNRRGREEGESVSGETDRSFDASDLREQQKDKGSPGKGAEQIDDIYEFLGDIAPEKDYEEPRINLLGEEVQTLDREKRQELVDFEKELHEELKDRLDLHSMEISNYKNPKIVRKVSSTLKELLEKRAHEIPPEFDSDQVFKEMMDQVCGLGPIEDLTKHKGVSEIMVVDRDHIYAELDGQIVLTDRFFNDDKAMMTVIERIVTPMGRRIDETTPLVDTRLPDGSRVNAVIPPVALGRDVNRKIRQVTEDIARALS
ncbi:MAG: ATPase, T2SS/T4P/T4SS family, partial [Bradymonadaceae bacterium]